MQPTVLGQPGLRAPGRHGWREALLVAGAIGLLGTVALANLRASRRDSADVICLSNMRALMRGAEVYAGDHALAGASLPVDRLASAGLVEHRVGRCPLGAGPGPDYLVTLRDGHPVSVICTVSPQRHRWLPAPDAR